MTGSMDNQQQHLNRCRRRRNLPAELKVEIVDCLPLENAVHFLANVPNRLIIHHCAPRIRRILKKISKIAADYVRTLPAPDSGGFIFLKIWHKYTPEMDVFLRYGAVHCNGLVIERDSYDSDHAFVGYPANFLDELIKYHYGTKVPEKAVRRVIIQFPWARPAPWPAALVQPQAREINVEEMEFVNHEKQVVYILRNKRNPGIAFELDIRLEGEANCYQQMTSFAMSRRTLRKWVDAKM